MATATTKKAPAKKAAPRKRIVIPKEPARLAQVPDKARYFDPYISRILPGGETDFEAFEAARLLKHNILIEGPTGSGKTSSVYAYAAWKGMKLYSISSSVGLDPVQLFGKQMPDGKGGLEWRDGPITDIVQYGGVLLINEINHIPEKVTSILFGLLDKRRKIELTDKNYEVVEVADDDNFVLFADMNPGYEGTRPLNKALRNRFAAKLSFDYDPAIESELVVSQTLQQIASQLRVSIRQGEFDFPVTTNMLFEFEEYALGSKGGIERAIDNFANAFDWDDRQAIKALFGTHRAGLDQDYATYQADWKDDDLAMDWD